MKGVKIMEKKLHRWSITLGFLAAALLLGAIPSSMHEASPATPEPARLVLVEQFTSTN
jgi:hypothetical protein